VADENNALTRGLVSVQKANPFWVRLFWSLRAVEATAFAIREISL
jgi:hypothetical protein